MFENFDVSICNGNKKHPNINFFTKLFVVPYLDIKHGISTSVLVSMTSMIPLFKQAKGIKYKFSEPYEIILFLTKQTVIVITMITVTKQSVAEYLKSKMVVGEGRPSEALYFKPILTS